MIKRRRGQLQRRVLQLLDAEPLRRYTIAAIARSIDADSDAVQRSMRSLLASRAVRQTELSVGRQQAYAYGGLACDERAPCMIVRMAPVVTVLNDPGI